MLHVVLRYMVATLRMGLGAVVMHRFSGRLYINILMIVYYLELRAAPNKDPRSDLHKKTSEVTKKIRNPKKHPRGHVMICSNQHAVARGPVGIILLKSFEC